MPNPKIRRRRTDYEKLQELASRSKYIHIEETKGSPPYEYIFLLTCKGISKIDSSGKPVYSSRHKLKLVLDNDYPAKKPKFEMLTDAFHPNISGSSICYGDDGDHGWTPGMGIDDVVVRIVEMIRYQNMGLNSAFSQRAAAWAEKNQRLFPLEDDQIISEELIEIEFLEAEPIIDTNILGSIHILDEDEDENILGEITFLE